MRGILVEDEGMRSHVDLRIMEFNRFSQDLHVKNPRLFRIKFGFNHYYVRSVDQAFFCEKLLRV